MRTALLTAMMILISASASGATTEVNPEPGLMTAGSPLYGLDVAFDRVSVATPFRDQGDVASERASEMVVAQRRNNTQAFDRAADQLNRTVEAADRRHSDGLTKAAVVLESVNASVPEEAQEGIATALEQVSRAQNRSAQGGLLSGDVSPGSQSEVNRSGSESGGGVPDIEIPGGR